MSDHLNCESLILIITKKTEAVFIENAITSVHTREFIERGIIEE